VQLAWSALPQRSEGEIDRGYAQIMGHIVPARTNAMGQIGTPLVEIDETFGFGGFSTSNHGHSAQFYGYLAEPYWGRMSYWLGVMRDGFRLNTNVADSYSGLSPRWALP
jgi:hypothetical protein